MAEAGYLDSVSYSDAEVALGLSKNHVLILVGAGALERQDYEISAASLTSYQLFMKGKGYVSSLIHRLGEERCVSKHTLLTRLRRGLSSLVQEGLVQQIGRRQHIQIYDSWQRAGADRAAAGKGQKTAF